VAKGLITELEVFSLLTPQVVTEINAEPLLSTWTTTKNSLQLL